MENLEQIKEVEKMGAYWLAQLAGVSDPDSQESAGAVFLKSIRDSIVEFHLEGDLTETTFNEIISGAPSIYYHEVMAEYTDLALWQHTDLRNYVEQIKEGKIEVTDIAAIQLIEVGYILGYAILNELGVEL